MTEGIDNVKIDHAEPLACLKRYFLKVLQRLSKFVSIIIKVKSPPPVVIGKIKSSVHLYRSLWVKLPNRLMSFVVLEFNILPSKINTYLLYHLNGYDQYSKCIFDKLLFLRGCKHHLRFSCPTVNRPIWVWFLQGGGFEN